MRVMMRVLYHNGNMFVSFCFSYTVVSKTQDIGTKPRGAGCVLRVGVGVGAGFMASSRSSYFMIPNLNLILWFFTLRYSIRSLLLTG